MDPTSQAPGTLLPGRVSERGCLVRVATAGLVGVLIGVPLAILVLMLVDRDPGVKHRSFDSRLWLDVERSTDWDENRHTLRQAMAMDLVEHVLHPGMERDAVLALLGAPSRWPVFDAARWFGQEDVAWYLGTSENDIFTPGDAWLFLDFDQQGLLGRALIVSESAAERRAP